MHFQKQWVDLPGEHWIFKYIMAMLNAFKNCILFWFDYYVILDLFCFICNVIILIKFTCCRGPFLKLFFWYILSSFPVLTFFECACMYFLIYVYIPSSQKNPKCLVVKTCSSFSSRLVLNLMFDLFLSHISTRPFGGMPPMISCARTQIGFYK